MTNYRMSNTQGERRGGAIAFRRRWHSFRRHNGGLAAIEFALIVSFLGISVLNVSDVAIFMFDKMELENATQMAARAAWAKCTGTSGMLPATVNCAALNAAVTAAIQSTPLGTAPTLASGYPDEAYYCVNSSGALVSVGAVTSTKPPDCSAVGNSAAIPGDYLQVETSYSFKPLFSGISLAALLPSTITNTAWVRLS